MRLDPAFSAALQQRFQLSDLDAHPESVLGLSADSRIAYFNPAWLGFATDNQGNPLIGAQWGLGAGYLDSISPTLRPFYKLLLQRAPSPDRSLHPSRHEYECSSASDYRRFEMHVYALPRAAGFVIVNSMVVERPHDPAERPAHAPSSDNYCRTDGVIVQCAHCRRVQHSIQLVRWDWVPTWVDRAPANTSHGLCPMCSDYYYPVDEMS